jgi:uncharacterized protein YjbI with pentapeptide repeats
MKILSLFALLPVFCRAFVPRATSLSQQKPLLLRASSEEYSERKLSFLSAAFVAVTLSTAAPAALAVSGGGLDFAGIDISGQDFSKATYKGKDFTQGE